MRHPVCRAVFHFISQTLLRVQRYRIYLVLYGGAGLSVVAATILRLSVVHGQIRVEVSADGLRAAVGITAFWTIVGLRMALVSPATGRESWVFRIVHGRPPQFITAMEQLLAGKTWVFLCALTVTFGLCVAMRAVAPPQLLTWQATASQLLVSFGMCLLLTDSFFLHVKAVAFTGEPAREQPNLAHSAAQIHCVRARRGLVSAGLRSPSDRDECGAFRRGCGCNYSRPFGATRPSSCDRARTLQHARTRSGEEDFPMKLGLRY